MSEPQEEYVTRRPPVTMTIDYEVAQMFNEILMIRANYKRRLVEPICVVDLHTLRVGAVIAFGKGQQA